MVNHEEGALVACPADDCLDLQTVSCAGMTDMGVAQGLRGAADVSASDQLTCFSSERQDGDDLAAAPCIILHLSATEI